MKGNFPACLAFTIGPSAFGPLGEEGGWSDNPADPGGATQRGITIGTYRGWCARNGLPAPSVDDLRLMPDSQRTVIYHDGYWRTVAGDALPLGIDLMLFDFGVDAGPGRSAEILQRAVGVAEDGAIGPVTLAAISALDAREVIARLAVGQINHYRADPDFGTFGNGWIARTERRRMAALAMVP